MGETFFTSDPHLGHTKVTRERGFIRVADHDRRILDGIRRRLRPGGRLFVLGDLTMGDRKDECLDRLSEVGELGDFDIHVILGNHDRPHPMNTNAQEHHAAWAKRFASVQSVGSLRRGGKKFLLSHFPYDGEGESREGDEDRAEQFRLRDLGNPLIHGHVHDTVRYRLSALGSPMYHVGLDAWGLAPVTFHELLAAGPKPGEAR